MNVVQGSESSSNPQTSARQATISKVRSLMTLRKRILVLCFGSLPGSYLPISAASQESPARVAWPQPAVILWLSEPQLGSFLRRLLTL